VIRVSYSYEDLTGGVLYQYPLHLVSTASTGSYEPRVSFKEQMRRLRQSLAELRYWQLEPLQAPARPRMAWQGRHGFQMAYRRPGYRAKRPR
jgi:hypothetical protein